MRGKATGTAAKSQRLLADVSKDCLAATVARIPVGPIGVVDEEIVKTNKPSLPSSVFVSCPTLLNSRAVQKSVFIYWLLFLLL